MLQVGFLYDFYLLCVLYYGLFFLDVLKRPSKDIANFPCVEEGSLNVKDACVDGVKVQVEVHSQLNSVWNKNKGMRLL